METAFRSEERFTQAEFLDWLHERPSSDINHYELLGGHIVMTPPAGYPHSPIAARIVAAMLEHVSARRLGIVNESSAGFDLPSGDTVEPDISFISSATLAAGPRPEPGRSYRLVPDLVVEIASRATARRDRTEKKRIYERNGVAEYWIVDPVRRNVTVFRLTGATFSSPLHVLSGSVESSVLPGLTVALPAIFADCE